MFYSYRDIIDAVGRDPIWFDESRVPRFVPFAPELKSRWMTDEAALIEICCQSCLTRFQLAAAGSTRGTSSVGNASKRTLADLIFGRNLVIGDPPNVGCCEVGRFTSAVPLRVLEYWHVVDRQWVRNGDLELPVAPLDWDDRFRDGFSIDGLAEQLFEIYRMVFSMHEAGDLNKRWPASLDLTAAGFAHAGNFLATIGDGDFIVDAYERGGSLLAVASTDVSIDGPEVPTAFAGINILRRRDGTAPIWALSKLPKPELTDILLSSLKNNDA